MNQRGFTLIELSIVLVILGLIVGGIVGGKALIHQAELQGIVREANSLKTAVNAFVGQYDALPGDFTDASQYWTGATNGDGSGGWGKAVWAPWHEVIEGFAAYDHLNKAEILPNSLTGLFGPAVPGDNIYASKLKGAGWQISGDWSTPLFGVYKSQFLLLGTSSLADPPWLWGGSLIAKDARSIDQKLDDGNPGTGGVLAEGTPGECFTNATLPTDYILSDTTNKCTLIFVYRE